MLYSGMRLAGALSDSCPCSLPYLVTFIRTRHMLSSRGTVSQLLGTSPRSSGRFVLMPEADHRRPQWQDHGIFQRNLGGARRSRHWPLLFPSEKHITGPFLDNKDYRNKWNNGASTPKTSKNPFGGGEYASRHLFPDLPQKIPDENSASSPFVVVTSARLIIRVPL